MKQITMDFQTYEKEIDDADRSGFLHAVGGLDRLAQMKKKGEDDEEIRLVAHEYFDEKADVVLKAIGVKTWKEVESIPEVKDEAQ